MNYRVRIMTFSDGMHIYAILHPETYQVRRYVVAHRVGVANDVRDALYPNFIVKLLEVQELPDNSDVMIFPAPSASRVHSR